MTKAQKTLVKSPLSKTYRKGQNLGNTSEDREETSWKRDEKIIKVPIIRHSLLLPFSYFGSKYIMVASHFSDFLAGEWVMNLQLEKLMGPTEKH